MEKDASIESEILKIADKFKRRAKVDGNGKRHDRILSDERKAMKRASQEIGWSVDTIAEKFERDKRTVSSALGRMKQEELESRVQELSVQAKQQALWRHYADLCQTVERWKSQLTLQWDISHPAVNWSSLVLERSSQAKSLAVEAEVLFGCIREHMPGSDIWRQFDEWKKCATEHLSSCYRLVEEIQTEATAETGERCNFRIVKWGEPGISGAFVQTVYTDAVHHALDYSGLEGLQYEFYRHGKGKRRYELWIGNQGIASSLLLKEARICQQIHSETLTRYRQSQHVLDLVSQRQDIDNAGSTLSKELDKIILRRLFPGTCHICPI